ncbi:hypothetical protein RHSIM_Rhsim04G0126200 [Rhododendron simsii]|uniref:Uncharacterized protein n=1 Tax=Rhododendron simsii TaxID=118357 RepID=A0A834H4D4_RHOSS|nr:hypothetical protein RHSIM_Rhsim04G0126200 [Rhododendron simsii]
MPGPSFPLIGSVGAQPGLQLHISSSMQLQQKHQIRLDDLDSFGSLLNVQPQSSASVSSVLSSSTGFTRPSRAITSARFGCALNIEALVAAAERIETPLELEASHSAASVRTTCLNLFCSHCCKATYALDHISEEICFIRPIHCIDVLSDCDNDLLSSDFRYLSDDIVALDIKAPASEIQDKISFIINNLSSTNFEAKIEQPLLQTIQTRTLGRFFFSLSDYKVISKPLNKEIVQATYVNCKVLIGLELIKSSSEEHSLPKEPWKLAWEDHNWQKSSVEGTFLPSTDLALESPPPPPLTTSNNHQLLPPPAPTANVATANHQIADDAQGRGILKELEADDIDTSFLVLKLIELIQLPLEGQAKSKNALEGQAKSKNGREKSEDAEDSPVSIVRIEEDMFILVDDVLTLLERAALEPLPPKDDKGPQNRMKVSHVNILSKVY